MIKTAMVGKQPERSLYRIRGGNLQMHLKPWHTNMSVKFHNAMKDFYMGLCIQRQVEAGIDILSEGEGLRDDYWQYFLEYTTGVEKMGNMQWKAFAKPALKKNFLGDDWLYAQSFTTKPVKITIPGPLTLASYVEIVTSELNKETLAEQFSKLVNIQIKDAVLKGCKHIQVDDPQLAFQPEIARDYGIELVGQCFEGIPTDVSKYLHICRGYPNRQTFLDSTNKAKKDCYLGIMPLLDKSPVDVISIENAFYPNSDIIFEMCQTKTLMLGVINIKSNVVETPEQIEETINKARRFIPDHRLIMAPDCGCACNPEAFVAKMNNLGKASKLFQ